MPFKLLLKKIDWFIVAIVVAFLVLNLINIYGIGDKSFNLFFKKQLIFSIVAISLIIFLPLLDYGVFKNNSYVVIIFYLFSLTALALTLFAPEIRAVRSWLILGNLGVETSQLMKLALIIILAKYLSSFTVLNWTRIFTVTVYVFIPVVLILLQPDFGTGAIFLILWFSSLIIIGLTKRHLSVIAFVLIALVMISWFFVLQDYQKERIHSFLNPTSDLLDSGYNAFQSKIAIGSGKIWGKGLGNGFQSKSGFLPEPYTDFSFSSFLEQFGLIGAITIIFLYLFLFNRLFKIFLAAKDNFSKIFIFLFYISILAQVIINIGMAIGIIPVTGLSLPFFSYGGSNLLTFSIGLGIIQSIKARM